MGDSGSIYALFLWKIGKNKVNTKIIRFFVAYLFKERIVKGMWTQPPEQIHKSLKLLCDFVQITWKCNFIQMYTLLKIHTWMYTDTHTHTQGTWLRDEEKLTWLVYKTVKPGLWVLWGLRTMFSCLMFPDHFLHVCFGFEFGI